MIGRDGRSRTNEKGNQYVHQFFAPYLLTQGLMPFQLRHFQV